MTDTQILTLAIAIVVPLALLLLSNSRLTDMRISINEVKETLRAEMRAQHVEVMSEIKANNTQINAKVSAIDAFLHEAVMGKLDELDTRLTALEGRK
jgi:hypothetical protein